MRLKTLKGKSTWHNINKYKIDWNDKSASKIQYQVKQFLEPYWNGCIVMEEFRIPGSRMKIDFYNANKNIAVEVDGKQHDDFNKHFHKNKLGLLKSFRRDKMKEEWCELNGITLCRIPEDDISELSEDYFWENFGIQL